MDIRHNLVGKSPANTELLRLIAAAARKDITVLILGESGTGKELVARAIHENSQRSQKPFIAINCASLSEHLLESELFGHERGSFTGALSQKQGLFELAQGGTVFLDEIGEMALAVQAKLLRVLQEREIRRVGGMRMIPIDVRIIAATHQDIEKCLRPDLRYRLDVFPIETVALRDRPSDIAILARHFASLSDAFVSSEAENVLMRFHWPGNVRQLQGAIDRALAVGTGSVIQAEDLPPYVFASKPEQPISDGRSLNYVEALDAARREVLENACARANGNLKKAAEILGITTAYIHALINKLNMPHLRNKRLWASS